jgi:hypothetical protein
MATIVNNEIERKPARITERCFEMLKEAMEYCIEQNVPKQAEIMQKQFFQAVDLLETSA